MNQMRKALLAAALSPPAKTDGRWEQTFLLKEDFPGFSGHFPGYPILPAMLQVLLGQLLAETVLNQPLHFVSLEKAKFMIQLRPGDPVEVSLQCREQDGCWLCPTELRVGGKTASRFTLLLKNGHRI